MAHFRQSLFPSLALALSLLAATASPAGGAQPRDPVKRTVERAFARGTIDAEERNGYLRSYTAAVRTERRLSGVRRVELGYVIRLLRRLGAQRRLSSRMPILFLTLDRNREWWSRAGPPASGARLSFDGSRVIFQYFPGRGLQFHPLANFGQANGFWYAHREGDLRSLIDDLVGLAVKRSGFLTWEYYFDYGGGAPPWISAMAQGTAMQALVRASSRLEDPALVEVARRARGAFARRTPVGVHAPQGKADWYALYSFAPRLNVLNGMLQAVNGLRTYAEYANDATALELFERGDSTARAQVGRFDTGAWSLYSRPGGQPGAEANLNYHTLNRDFARNLCRATDATAYCTAAEHFTSYLSEDPTLEPVRAVPAPARAGRGVRFRFKLSKISTVGIVVRQPGGAPVLSTSATFPYGSRYFRWIPPAARRERLYEFRITARDLAGNTGFAEGSVRVKGRRKG